MGRRGALVAVLVAVLGSACSVETPFDGESATRSSQIDRLRFDAVVLPNGVVQVSESVTFGGDGGGTIALGGSPLGGGLVQTPITLPEITLPPGVELPPGITLPSIPNLPGLPTFLPGQSSVTNVAVDGAPAQTTETPFGGQELRVAKRSAIVTFDVTGAVERFPDIAVLDLPVLPSPEGASRQDPDVELSGTVRFSGNVAPELVEAHLLGGRDRTTAVDGGHLTFASRAPVWAPGNALYVGFPASLVPESTEFSNLYATQFRAKARARLQASDDAEQVLDSVDETNRIGRLIFFIVAISLPALFLLRLVIHYVAVKISQRREVGDVPEELSQPPTEDDPAVVGVLWGEGKPVERAVAGTMLALAHRRAISIEEYGERVVVRVPLMETGANETEAHVLSGLRANASADGVIEGPPVWRSFPGWRDYRRAAVAAAVKVGHASRVIRIVDISGLLVTTGIGIGLVSGIDLIVIMPVFTIAAVVLSVFFTVIAGYGLTKQGRRARALWKAFGEYVEHNAEFRDVGPAGVAIWGPYLVYGAVIGEAKHAAEPLTP